MGESFIYIANCNKPKVLLMTYGQSQINLTEIHKASNKSFKNIVLKISMESWFLPIFYMIFQDLCHFIQLRKISPNFLKRLFGFGGIFPHPSSRAFLQVIRFNKKILNFSLAFKMYHFQFSLLSNFFKLLLMLEKTFDCGFTIKALKFWPSDHFSWSAFIYLSIASLSFLNPRHFPNLLWLLNFSKSNDG